MHARRYIDLQIRAIVVTYRIEQRRRDPRTMKMFRARADGILRTLDQMAEGYPDLRARVDAARRHIRQAGGSAGGGGEQSFDGREQIRQREWFS